MRNSQKANGEKLTESGTLYAKQEAYRQLAKHSLAKGDLQKAADLLLNYEKYTDSIAITMQAEAPRSHSLHS